MSEPFEITVARRQTKTERQVSALSTIESGFTMGDVIGTLQMFPELRGLWPFSSVDESGNLRDISGQGRTLTNNGTTPRALLNNIVPYATHNGTTQYFSRADEAGLDITGAMTFGVWCSFTATAAQQAAASKYTAITNNRAYRLNCEAGGAPSMNISADGIALVSATGTAGDITAGAMGLLIGRFTPSTEIAVFYNKLKYTTTVGVPAAIFNSNAAFIIAGTNARASLAGRTSLGFLCAAAVPDSLLARFFEVSRGFFGV